MTFNELELKHTKSWFPRFVSLFKTNILIVNDIGIKRRVFLNGHVVGQVNPQKDNFVINMSRVKVFIKELYK